jgi:hypothetical protein
MRLVFLDKTVKRPASMYNLRAKASYWRQDLYNKV